MDGFPAFIHRVVRDRDGKRLVRVVAVGPVERAARRGVVRAGGGRRIAGRVVDADGPVTIEQSVHRDGRRPVSLDRVEIRLALKLSPPSSLMFTVVVPWGPIASGTLMFKSPTVKDLSCSNSASSRIGMVIVWLDVSPSAQVSVPVVVV